jgi:hypothetical protein
MMKRSLVTSVVGSVLLLVENNDTPADWEWDETLGMLRELKAKSDVSGEQPRVLVVTLGGGPNATQRRRLEEVLGGVSLPVAVVSDSLKMRFITAAVTLFNSGHKAFSTAERLEAYKHLKLATSQTRQLEASIAQMQKLVQPEPKAK